MLPPIITFLIVLSIVVLIHELGHFMAAKWAGVKVHEFGFGYPPRAFGFYKDKKGKWKHVLLGKDVDDIAKGTVYSVNWLPLGGFVRMFGEFEKDAMGSRSKQAFFNKSIFQRSVIILAGVVMNLVLAVVFFSVIYSVSGIPEEVDYISVGAIAPGSPAEMAGLSVGDKILSIDGNEMNEVAGFVDYVGSIGGNEMIVSINRKGVDMDVALTPRVDPPEGEGAVGVLISNYDNVFYPTWEMPFRGAVVGVQEAYGWTKMMITGIGGMFATLVAGEKPEVSGPVGIYQITSSVADQGLLALMKFIGILSINLAVVNILPFPALDGGRFVFILWEGITGKRVKPAIEGYVNLVGMALLLLLMALVTVGDVTRLMGK